MDCAKPKTLKGNMMKWIAENWLYLCIGWGILWQIIASGIEEDLPIDLEPIRGKLIYNFRVFEIVKCSVIYFTGYFAINFFESSSILGIVVIILGIVVYHIVHLLHNWTYDRITSDGWENSGEVRMADAILVKTETLDQFRETVGRFFSEGIKWATGCEDNQEDLWNKHKENTCIIKQKREGKYILRCGSKEDLDIGEDVFALSFSEFIGISKEQPVKHL